MTRKHPKPITPTERIVRQSRVVRVARAMGFEGRIEYRHVISQSGGAQYGLAASIKDDLLAVYAEAFDRDSNPDDYSLVSIVAHERGHQLLARHPRLIRCLPKNWSGISEEIVASLLGSMLVEDADDKQDLLVKAIFDAVKQGLEQKQAVSLIAEIRELLEMIL